MKYPLTLEDQKSFEALLTSLQLVTLRLHQSSGKPDNTPLDAREIRALEVISKQLQRHLDGLPVEARNKTEATIREAIDIMGTRAYLNLFLVPPKVMGVPFIWFVVNALICIMLFVYTSNFSVIFFVAPAVHVIGYIIAIPQWKQQREHSIMKLLGEAFPD